MMDELSITFIGTGDAFGSGGRGHTCFFVKGRSLSFLIDCGATALQGLKKLDISTNEIDIIAISHFHGDHIAGFPFIILDMAFRMCRQKPLTIISPRGGKERLEAAFSIFYKGSEHALEVFPIHYIEFEGQESVSVDALQLESFPVIHSPASQPHGFRITIDNKVIAYSGDTEWTGALPFIVKDADLAIIECCFYAPGIGNHLNYHSFRQHLPELKCKRLILTHFFEDMLAHLHEVEEECAWDGLQISI